MKNTTLGGNLQIVDLVRSLSILSVLAYHLAPALNRFDISSSWFWERISSNGPGGVFMFFVISGFLITRTIDTVHDKLFDPDLRTFYTKRAGRIIPLFSLYVFLGLAMVTIIISFLGDTPKARYCFELPRNPWDMTFWISLLTFSNNWVAVFCSEAWGTLGNHWSLIWSLCVEEQFYLIYPLILVLLRNRTKTLWLFMGVSLISLFWKLVLPDIGFSTGAVAIRMNIASYGLISDGILLYLACKAWGSYLFQRQRFCAALAIPGFLALVFSYSGYLGEHWIYRDLSIGPGLFMFLLGGIHLRIFESRYFRLLAVPGKYSYGAYLFHIVILYLIHPLLICQGPLVAFALYAMVTTIVAMFSFHFFEKPANHFVRNLFGVA